MLHLVRLARRLRPAYSHMMVVLIRLVRVLLILALAVLTVSLVIGIGSRETGGVEKLLLVALIATCVFAAARVTTFSSRLQQHIPRH